MACSRVMAGPRAMFPVAAPWRQSISAVRSRERIRDAEIRDDDARPRVAGQHVDGRTAAQEDCPTIWAVTLCG